VGKKKQRATAKLTEQTRWFWEVPKNDRITALVKGPVRGQQEKTKKKRLALTGGVRKNTSLQKGKRVEKERKFMHQNHQ